MEGFDKEEEMRLQAEAIREISSGSITHGFKSREDASEKGKKTSPESEDFESFNLKIEQLRKKIRKKNKTQEESANENLYL